MAQSALLTLPKLKLVSEKFPTASETKRHHCGAQPAEQVRAYSLVRKPQVATNPAGEARDSGRQLTANCRPFHGLQNIVVVHPGACAPGYMLTPASQAHA